MRDLHRAVVEAFLGAALCAVGAVLGFAFAISVITLFVRLF